MSRYKGVFIGLGAVAVLAALFWGVVGYWMDADARFWQWLTETFWGRGHWPNGFNVFGATPWAYLVLAIVFALIAFAVWPHTERPYYDYNLRKEVVKTSGHSSMAYVAAAMAVLLVVSSVLTLFVGADDRSDSWAGNTIFTAEDPAELPTSLRWVDAQYVEQGEFSQAWEPRVASATGANTVISRSSEADSGTTLLSDTLTYTYGSQPGWTAIRDGRKQRPLYGVAFWPGQGNVETCRFTGEFSMDKAFHGRLGKSLLDEIAAYNKSLFFDEADMWGFCQPAGDPSTITDDQPIIVIPVKTWDGAGNRSTWHSAGVLVVTGSPSGDAVIEHVRDVEQGEYPGPVYPVSLAAMQREETQFMAGKWNKWFRDFGFETTGVESQAGNASEFLLRSAVDGRLYWVTPLTAKSSDSQVVSAYSLIPADEATFDEVNDLRIYVLQNDDPRLVNLDDLEARTRQAISESDPGLFPAGGSLVEFLPLDDSSWQVYAELGGRVVYRITVPTDSRIRPVVTSLDGVDEAVAEDAQPSASNEEGSSCAADLGALTDAELAACLSDVADEMNHRQQEP